MTSFFPAGAFGFGAEPFCWGVVDMVVNAKRGGKASDTKPRGDLRWENADFTRSMEQIYYTTEMAVGEWENGALDECDNEVGVQV